MAGKAAGDAFLFAPGRKKAPGRRAPGQGDLRLHNDYSKGVGTAIDGFVSDCDFQAGDGGGVKIGITGGENYHRADQICAFHERGFDIRDIRRLEGDGGSGVVGAQDVRQGIFDALTVDWVAFVKDIITTAIFGDPVFIEQGGDIAAELGNLVADGDIIVISPPVERVPTYSTLPYLRL